ncbi:substrate-binding domain-containing protein [Deinococcus sp.]|uniref:substrate-binding domain-containing protein n=1 Tax=Deinococcus sp. TaxID=47478 RepID=UPI003B58E84E
MSNTTTARLLSAALLLSVSAAQAQDALLTKAKAYVVSATAPVTKCNGPTTGPKAAAGKSVIYISGDGNNGGITGVAAGVKEAAGVIGWTYRQIDGRGTVAGHSTAMGQAIALKPSAIVVGGFDAAEQADLITQADKAGIVVVAWHAGPQSGPIATPKIFTNVTTPIESTATAAAYYAIANSDGKAGVVVFTDSTARIAMAKANAMADIIKTCKTCTLLEIRNQAIAGAIPAMPQVTSSLLQKYGNKWNYSLAINDIYFDGMVPALSAAGIKPTGQLINISAGDGSISAYQRIRDGQYQDATIPEPLNLQGWQLVDEINRALAGQKPSNYSIPVHLVTKANINADGGDKNLFDPQNNYRAEYRKIWGK